MEDIVMVLRDDICKMCWAGSHFQVLQDLCMNVSVTSLDHLFDIPHFFSKVLS